MVGTSDSTEVTARLTVSATGAAVPNAMVVFRTDCGSFNATVANATMAVVTDAAGAAKATLFVVGAQSGTASLDATALDAMARTSVSLVSVVSIVSSPDGAVKSVLGLRSGEREASTPVLFKVLDASGAPAAGIAVRFDLAGAGGTSLTPASGTSGAQGLVRTTLEAGDQVGGATVKATVAATLGLAAPLSANATFQIVGSKPSFRGLVVDCARKNLAALTLPGSFTGFPTRSLRTTCSARLADRFNNPVALPTQVAWFSERGTMGPAISAAGTAVTTYDTVSSIAPEDTVPLTSPIEPANGARNPRDMIITIIAVVAGEEELGDANANGKWDRGEWYVDLPEPFIDQNDNQRWEPGEASIDTWRLNCATGVVEPPNGHWDTPNGCWDKNTQIFAATHVVWSGSFSQPIEFALAPPWSVPPSTTVVVNFSWADAYYNQISPDKALLRATLAPPGSPGAVTVVAPGFDADGLGHGILYERLEATESAYASGVFTVHGTCDTSKPGPANPLTRCIARYRFASFGRGRPAELHLTGQPLLPDGGAAPAATATVDISGRNEFFTPQVQSYGLTLE